MGDTAEQNALTILLKGGTILQHGANDQVRVVRDTDLLVEGGIIAKIGRDLTASPGARVIDCRGKVISPGFVDTHHHVWQTQLKGRHSDDTLLDYTARGLFRYGVSFFSVPQRLTFLNVAIRELATIQLHCTRCLLG